jgi:ketosteroid isomerase-like protein
MAQDNLQVVQAFYEAVGSGTVPVALGHLDANVEWNEAENFVYADHSPYVGIDNLVNGLFMRLMTEWEGFAAVPEQFIASGDRVAVLGRYSGTYRETGKPMNAQMVHVFKVADGKIVHFQQYTDTAQFRDVTK